METTQTPAVVQPSIEERISAYNAPEETPAPEQPAQAEDDGAAVPAVDAVAEETDADVPADTGTDAGGEVEETIVSSLSELMESIEADPADMYNLTFPVNVNGKRVDVPLGEYKDSYVASQEARKHQEEAKALRSELEQQRTAKTAQYEAQLAQGAAMVQALEQQTLARFQGVNWQELRDSDPSEWSAKMTELSQAKQQLEGVKSEVANKIQEFQQQQKLYQEETLQARLSQERSALEEAWPEMADESKAEPERVALIDELKSRGFTQQEIGNAYDHRILLLARDAMRWRQSASKADAARKKVVRVGKKVIKPGARQSTAEVRQEGLKPLRDRLRKTGDWRDAAALLSRTTRN